MYNTDRFNQMTLDEKHQFFMEAYGKLRKLGIIGKWYEFAELLDVSANSVSGAKNKNPDYLTSSLLVKVADVLERYSDQAINISHSPHTNVATGHGHISLFSVPSDGVASEDDREMIPIIPLNLYKESNIDILEYIHNVDNDIQRTPAIRQFPKTDAVYSVQTMAMYPHLYQGDLLALKVVNKFSPIINGEMYAIDTIDNGILIRFAYDRGDQIEMRASDKVTRFESVIIDKADIFNIFRIVGMVRTNI